MTLKKKHPKEKTNLHPRNRHRRRYDFGHLIRSCPELARFVSRNEYGDESVDFFDPDAVLMLNRALLKHFYGIGHWSIPRGYLCPPIPGRADYIHYVADLLAGKNRSTVPTGGRIRCLDIGVGASCVYPIIGVKEYGWSFVGTDIDSVSLASAAAIVAANPGLKKKIELRLQHHKKDVFRGVIGKDERFDAAICNPPFHASPAEARSGSVRKLKNLRGARPVNPVLNFGGRQNELWCEGGEAGFIQEMIRQSREFRSSCFWFTTLVSKGSNVRPIQQALRSAEAAEVQTIPVSQGSKSGRIVAWTFLAPEEQSSWRSSRWH